MVKLTSLSWFSTESLQYKDVLLLKKEILNQYSDEGDIVFDPFLNGGETLEVCHMLKRNGVSFSPLKEHVEDVQKEMKSLESQLQLTSYGSGQLSKQLILKANIEELDYQWQQYSLPKIDLVVGFLPSWGVLLKKVKEFSPGRSVSPVAIIENILLSVKDKIKEGAYIILLCENSMTSEGYYTFAWEIVNQLKKHFYFKGEKICCIKKGSSTSVKEDDVSHKYLLFFRKE